jgi:uncharacterized phage protein (TIGR01671 family)
MNVIKFRQPTFNRGEFSGFHYWGFINDQNFTSPIPPIDKAQKDSQMFTNLHDKNGVEIFEGDVVAVMGSECSKCPAKDENGDCQCDTECPVIEKERDVVTMERFPIFWLENEEFGYEGEDLQSPQNCEIIGNIHENPELLKG